MKITKWLVLLMVVAGIVLTAHAQRIRNVKGVGLEPGDIPVISQHTGRVIPSGITIGVGTNSLTAIMIGDRARLVALTNGVMLEVWNTVDEEWKLQTDWTEE